MTLVHLVVAEGPGVMVPGTEITVVGETWPGWRYRYPVKIGGQVWAELADTLRYAIASPRS